MSAMLEMRDIDVFRGETQVLWRASLSVSAGERVAILGSNGAGKSSLMAAVTGTLPPKAGEIRFNGTLLNGRSPHQITRMGIALVPEGRRVYKDMTVKENLEIGAYPKRGRARISDTLKQVCALFPILDERRSQHAGTLSGGEQQMLAIGRALMSRPDLLLIDELSLGLAPRITKEIYAALSGLETRVTILLVEQNVELALQNARRAYIVESGRITREGQSDALMADADIRRAYLGM